MSDVIQRTRPLMPGQCHERFAHQRDDLLHWLDETRDVYRLVLEVSPLDVESSHASMDPLDRTYTQLTLTRRKVQAWAPFVGKPFGYWWHVGVDNEGNGISGTNVRRWGIEYGPLFNAWLMEQDFTDPLIDILRCYIALDVPDELAVQALAQARTECPDAGAGWLIERAAVIVRTDPYGR